MSSNPTAYTKQTFRPTAWGFPVITSPDAGILLLNDDTSFLLDNGDELELV